jgi:hypothetical protein
MSYVVRMVRPRRRHDLAFAASGTSFLGLKISYHQHISTKHERRRKVMAIGNATCGKHENIASANASTTGRNGMERSAQPCPLAFGPLCDDDVRTNIDRVVRVIEGMHLANQRHAGLLYALGIWPWIREGQHHGARMPFVRDIEQSRIFRDGPCNEASSDIRSGYLR